MLVYIGFPVSFFTGTGFIVKILEIKLCIKADSINQSCIPFLEQPETINSLLQYTELNSYPLFSSKLKHLSILLD
jgi:hypothetical protein